MMKIIVFVLLVLLSPWFVMYFLFPPPFEIKQNELYKIDNQLRINEINELRGECAEKLGRVCTLLINKVTWNAREGISRIVESYDLQFLWLLGDLETSRSSRVGGALFGTYVLSAVFAFGFSQHKKWLVLIALLVSLPTVFVENHYHTTPRIGVLVFVTWLAATGLTNLASRKKYAWIYAGMVVFFVIEFILFTHNFINHFLKI